MAGTEWDGDRSAATWFEAEETTPDLLEQALAATRRADRAEMPALIRTLTEEARAGTIRPSKTLTQSLEQAIALIDQRLSAQLSAVMHSPDVLRLEGSWRGLHRLVTQAETGPMLKIRLLDTQKEVVGGALASALEFDQSEVFRKVYEAEFGTPGGHPYGVLIADYEFSHSPRDVDFLSRFSKIAAAAFCPVVASASPGIFGFDSFTDLARPRPLEPIFADAEHSPWSSFRDTDDSRFVVLTLPHMLARAPYQASGQPGADFVYDETPGPGKPLPHEQYCWSSAAYAVGLRMAAAFAETGFCTAIRGVDSGGKVDGLPAHAVIGEDGGVDYKCPTEVPISDRREAELSKLGFLPLCHFKGSHYAVFFGAESCQRPKAYDTPAARDNAAIMARLPYTMAASRFAHYLKVIARDRIGSFNDPILCEEQLNAWISNYVNAMPDAGVESRARYPLREAKVTVREVPGAFGAYHAVIHLRPWLHMEELTASMRMVARIPRLGQG